MSHYELRFSQPGLRELARQLQSPREPRLFCAVGRLAHGNERRWLVHTLHRQAIPGRPQLLAVREDDPSRIEATARKAIDDAEWNEEILVLSLGLGAAQGRLAAAWCFQGRVEPVQQFVLVGPGWLRLPRFNPEFSPSTSVGPPLEELLARTIGALGQATFRTLRQLTVAVIGCGRIGSLVAEVLASVGVARLILVDADHLELHNLGEMAGVALEDFGKPKVTALAQGIRRGAVGRGTDIRAVIEPVDTLPALFAVKAADILVSCADSAAARLAAAVLASSYLQPLLDLGTGILPDGPGRRMGADVRLVLPGRCLVCWGGVVGLAAASAALLAGRTVPPPADFRDQRQGSLRSLNGIASSLGLTLLEQFLAGWLGESTWLQVDISAAGVPQLTHRTPLPAPSCPLCTLAGLGDAALEDLPPVLRRLAE
jgi:molybdopterin/thiamine biosynthesis adenylyltransferase